MRLLLFITLCLASESQARIFQDCGQAFEELVAGARGGDFRALPAGIQQFVSDQLLPTAGRRVFAEDEDKPRTWRVVDNGLTLSGYGAGNDIHIRMQSGLKNPHYRMESNGNRTIFIPTDFDFNALPDKGQSFVLQALRGHTLQPYAKSKTGAAERLRLGEPALLEKEVQQEGIQAFNNAIDDGDDSFLFVGPTGLGKTIILQGAMTRQIQDSAENMKAAQGTSRVVPAIHILFTDREALTGQLHDDISGIDADYHHFRWGGQKEDANTPKTIDELFARVDAEMKKDPKRDGPPMPIVLSTTTRSLIERIGKTGDTRDYNLELLKQYLATLVIDEAHHAGAPQTMTLIRDLRGQDADGHKIHGAKGTDAKLVGFTATPTHAQIDVIAKAFHDNAFWAYLDTAVGYRANRGSIDRQLSDILEQLETALVRGEAHPFKTFFLRPERFNETGTPLFVQKKPGRGQRYELNPKHYDNFFNGISSVIESNKHLFFACSTIDEAKDFAKYMTEDRKPPFKKPDGTPHTVAVLHSGLSKKEKDKIRADFEKGTISTLFTVGMMNEGINVPTLTAFIDTNRDTNIKDLVQRIGRITRLTEGKTKLSDVVSFQEVTNAEMAAALNRLNNLGNRDWNEKPGDPDEPNNPGEPGDGADHKVGPTTIKPLVDTQGKAHNIQWTDFDLKQAERSFRNTPQDVEKANQAYQRIAAFLKVDGDAMASPTLSNRVTHDLLSDLTDRQSNVAALVFDSIANAAETDPSIAAGLKRFQDRRQRLLKQLRSPGGAVEAAKEFIFTYRRNPENGDNRTRDEQNLHDTLQRLAESGSIAFFEKALERFTPEQLESMGIRRHLDAMFATPKKTLEMADRFYQAQKRMPDENAAGFEGVLGKRLKPAVEQVVDAHTRDEFEDLVLDVTTQDGLLTNLLAIGHDRMAANDAVRTAEEAARQKKAQKRATPSELFDRAVAKNRAKLGEPKKTIKLRLKGQSSIDVLGYYQSVAQARGFSIDPVPAGGGDYDVTIKSDNQHFPSDYFGKEQGNHVVYVKERGQKFKRTVTVLVDGAGAVQRGDGFIRKFDFSQQTPTVEVPASTGSQVFKIHDGSEGDTQAEVLMHLLN